MSTGVCLIELGADKWSYMIPYFISPYLLGFHLVSFLSTHAARSTDDCTSDSLRLEGRVKYAVLLLSFKYTRNASLPFMVICFVVSLDDALGTPCTFRSSIIRSIDTFKDFRSVFSDDITEEA